MEYCTTGKKTVPRNTVRRAFGDDCSVALRVYSWGRQRGIYGLHMTLRLFGRAGCVCKAAYRTELHVLRSKRDRPGEEQDDTEEHPAACAQPKCSEREERVYTFFFSPYSFSASYSAVWGIRRGMYCYSGRGREEGVCARTDGRMMGGRGSRVSGEQKMLKREDRNSILGLLLLTGAKPHAQPSHEHAVAGRSSGIG